MNGKVTDEQTLQTNYYTIAQIEAMVIIALIMISSIAFAISFSLA